MPMSNASAGMPMAEGSMYCCSQYVQCTLIKYNLHCVQLVIKTADGTANTAGIVYRDYQLENY